MQQQLTVTARPDWVRRINEEGRCIDSRGVVPLDEESLIASAVRATGLRDFGEDDWREPFRVLIDCLEKEADLNLLGRLRMRAEILLMLEGRLRVEDAYKQHPEINAERISRPIIVAGQTRTGSSFLNNLLAANPEDGALLHWEAILPCPPPEKSSYRDDSRIERAHKWITQCTRIAPVLESMHEFSASLPIECCQLIAMSFRSDGWFPFLANIPGYQAYLAQQDPRIGLRYHKRVLQLLQWRNPRRHWVLKENMNLFKLPALFDVYPDACFVWSHRDPVRAVASARSIVGAMHWCGTDDPLKPGVLALTVDAGISAAAIDKVIQQIETGAVPRQQLHHVHYKELVRNPINEVERLYRRFGIPYTDIHRRAIAKFLIDNPRDNRPPHRFELSDELTSKARHAYRAYQDYFKVESE